MKNLTRIFLILCAALVTAASVRAQVIVIANPTLKADSVSRSDLKAVFTGASTRIAAGDRVVPVLLRQGDTHNTFTSKFLDKSPIALTMSWRGLVMSGQAAMPRTFDTEAQEVEYVAHTVGAIGYISQETPHGSVKVLAVR
jgi:ABC-type phosphate transport system substrate-binding protein